MGGAGQAAVDSVFGAFDLSGVSEGSRVVNADYDYEAVIKKTELKTTSNNEKMIELELSITWCSGPKWDEYNGVTLWDNIVMTEKVLWKYKGLMRACELLDATGSRSIMTSVSQLNGNVLRFRTFVDTSYNNTPRSKVQMGYTAGFSTPGLL
jgi:hypothetical protein